MTKETLTLCKSVIHNAYMLERFIFMSVTNPDTQVIDKLFKELIIFYCQNRLESANFQELL